MARDDQKYAPRTEVNDLSRRVDGIGRDSREARTGVQTLVARLDDVNGELSRKPTTKTFYVVFGLVLAIALTFLTLYFSNHLPAVVESKLAPISERVGKLETKVDSLNEKAGKLEAKLDALFEGLLRHPTSGSPDQVKTKLAAATVILNEAEKRDIELDVGLIQEGGQELVSYEPPMPELVPIAWDAATQFVNYRSFLNDKLYPVPVPQTSSPQALMLPARGISRVENIKFVGFEQELDHGDWVNPTFVRSTIVYNGEEMRITNARFQDCQFRITMNPNGRKFIRALLASHTPTEAF